MKGFEGTRGLTLYAGSLSIERNKIGTNKVKLDLCISLLMSIQVRALCKKAPIVKIKPEKTSVDFSWNLSQYNVMH